MATITGLTAARMLSIEGQSVVSGAIVGGHLILTKFDGTTVDAGAIPPGPTGPAGPMGNLIPGEIKLWPGSSLPLQASWGKWVWADGAIYQVATYPLASANIATGWRTFGGASDPPAGQFRVPDLRGLIPAGMDAMPGGTRANRVTRSIAITLAGKTGEEVHVITLPEMASHNHSVSHTLGISVNDPGHNHDFYGKQYSPAGTISYNTASSGDSGRYAYSTSTEDTGITASLTGGITAATQGSNNAHENMQPTVFVPYIVKLDG